MKSTLAAAAATLLLISPVPGAQAPPPPAPLAGTWDLTWQTRKGPKKEGRFVITQQGRQIRGEIHGRGSIKTKGTANGSAFTLRGSRLAVPYTISGRVSGDRMEGTIKVLSVTRHFTGARRP